MLTKITSKHTCSDCGRTIVVTRIINGTDHDLSLDTCCFECHMRKNTTSQLLTQDRIFENVEFRGGSLFVPTWKVSPPSENTESVNVSDGKIKLTIDGEK